MTSKIKSLKKSKTAIDVEILELEAIQRARKSMLPFVKYTMPDYSVKWFNRSICKVLDRVASGELKKVLINVPPQHGKSQLSSRHFPAYMLGKNKDLKIALCSYQSDHARAFNRDVQRIITDPFYNRVFPETKISGKNVTSSEDYRRTMDYFEVVDSGGFMKTTGVGGPLTGTSVDLGIIDDPFKDRAEAESEKIREKVWNWYTDVFKTRLHNDSQQVLLFTRWHEDDLAGKILEDEPGEWTVIKYRGLREPNDNTPDDPREVGEALWPEKHSRERLEKVKEKNPRTFASLYQQRPAPLEGSILKRDFFQVIDALPLQAANAPTHFVIDTGYTAKTQNDPSAILAYKVFGNFIYFVDYIRVWAEFSELILTINKMVATVGNGKRSKVYIEPKASGLSVIQFLKKETDINAIKYKLTDGDKLVRLMSVEPILQAQRAYFVRGPWNDQFITECLTFPNGKHDEAVDTLTMGVTQGLLRSNFNQNSIGFSRAESPI